MSDDDWDTIDDDDNHWSDNDPDEIDAVDCPECGAAMYDYLDKCPQCGIWLSATDRLRLQSSQSRPLWQRGTAAILIAGFLILLLLAGLTIF